MEKLTQWRNGGFRLVMATQRHDPKALVQQLARVGLAPLLDQVVACDHADGGAGKAHRVREILAAAPDKRCLWISDTEIDIEAARNFGCPVWAVTCGIRTEPYLKSLAPDFLSWGVRDIELERVWR